MSAPGGRPGPGNTELKMIPFIMHQTWKSKTDIPDNFRFWSKSFLDLNPSIDYRIYDDHDNYELVENTFPELLPLYKDFPQEIFRADFVRPLYLFNYGGLYADMDFQCLQPLTSIFSSNAGIIVGKMGTDDEFKHSIPNAMMASSPHQGFWLGYLAHIENAWRAVSRDQRIRVSPSKITGPVTLKEAVLEYLTNRTSFQNRVQEFISRHSLKFNGEVICYDQLCVLPSHIWYPINWNGKVHGHFREKLLKERKFLSITEAQQLFESSLAVTYWSHSWGESQKGPKFWRSFKKRLNISYWSILKNKG